MGGVVWEWELPRCCTWVVVDYQDARITVKRILMVR